VLRDETGMVFLLYRSSIPFARWDFWDAQRRQLCGTEVKVEGMVSARVVRTWCSKLTDGNGRVEGCIRDGYNVRLLRRL